MDAKLTGRRFAILHRAFRPRATDASPGEPPRLRTLAAQALWLGLFSAWLEVGMMMGHRALIGTVSRVTISFHTYRVPMSVLAHLAIFAAWLVLAAVLSCRRLRFRRTDRLVSALGWFLALASPLLFFEELHWWSSLLVAAGVSLRLGPWWLRHRGTILRRTLLPLGVGSVLAGGLSFAWIHTAEDRALAALPPAKPDAPNVVFLVLDTVRADHLSLYGYHRETTPHLEALAKRAVRFDFARAPSSWTLPSHATMFTGRWPHELSVDIDRPLDDAHPTLAEFLGDHGYLTAGFVGNTFYCNSWFGVDRGFAHYEDTYENRTPSVQQTLRSAALGRYLMPLAVQAGIWPTIGQYSPRKTAEKVNDDALAWLDGVEGRPFFLFLNYIDAHGPYTLPDDFPREFCRTSRQELIDANDNARRKGNNRRVPEPERKAALENVARLGIDAYDDCLRYLDDQIARLTAELDRRGLSDNTWIIITADHGEHFGEHGKYWHGNTVYRPVIDVPLLIVPPSGFSSRQVSTPVSPRDLPATVADVLGLDASSPFPGRSLRRHWDETAEDASSSSAVDEATLSEVKIIDGDLAAKGIPERDRFRAAAVADDKIYHRSPVEPEELYDVADLEEAKNLAPSPESSEALERFRSLMDEARQAER